MPISNVNSNEKATKKDRGEINVDSIDLTLYYFWWKQR